MDVEVDFSWRKKEFERSKDIYQGEIDNILETLEEFKNRILELEEENENLKDEIETLEEDLNNK